MTDRDIAKGHNDIVRAVRDLRETIVQLDSKLSVHIAADQETQEKIVEHMEEVKPFLQGVAGIQILWKVFVSIGSLAVAWFAIKNIFHL